MLNVDYTQCCIPCLKKQEGERETWFKIYSS
jgi:hypothetical protein